LGLLLKEPLDKAGMRMIEGNLTDYTNAVGVGWALANGVDPTVASRLLKQAEAAVDSQVKMLNEELKKTVQEMEDEATHGEPQSQRGAKPTKGSKTSGKPAPPKS
jgi:3-methyladenine DNA glycosylase AlkD